MEVEAEAESKATGEADVKAGLQRGGDKVVFFVLIETIPCPPHPHYSLIQDSDAVQLDLTIKEMLEIFGAASQIREEERKRWEI